MSRSKGSASELLQAIVDDVGDADDLKGVTGLLRSAVRDLLASRHDASSLPKTAAFFSSPEGAIVLLVARPASTLRFFAALLDHTHTQIRKLLDLKDEHERRFIEDKLALGHAWDLVMGSILLSLEGFLDPTEARAKPLTAHDEDLLGMICYASLIRILTADRVLPAVQRRILDIFEDSTHLCVENKNRLIRPELLGGKRLADLLSVAEDYGVTSRALELAFRLRSHLARTSSTAAVSISSFEAALFPSAVFGPEESRKLRGMFHRLKAREWNEGSLSLLQELSDFASSNFKLVFAVTLHANNHRFLCTDLDKPREDYQDFVAFNRRSITANMVSYLTDTDAVHQTLETPLSSIKSVELFDSSEDYMTCRIILLRSPTVESTPLELPQNEADSSLGLGIRLSDVPRLQQVLVMRKIPYNARAPEQPDVTERNMAYAERRKVEVEPTRPEERPLQHALSGKDSASPARRQLDSPTSSPDHTTRPTRAGPKRIPRKASEVGAGKTEAGAGQPPRQSEESDSSLDLPKAVGGKTPVSRRDVAPRRPTRPPPSRTASAPKLEPKGKSSSRQKMPWDDETPEKKKSQLERQDESVPFDREDSDMGGAEQDFDPGPRPERQVLEVKDDRETAQEPPSHVISKVRESSATMEDDEDRKEPTRHEEKGLMREPQSPVIPTPLVDDPIKENVPTVPSILTRSKAPSHIGAPKVDPIASRPLIGASRSPLAPLAFDFGRHKTGRVSPVTKVHPRPEKRVRTPTDFGQTPLAKRARQDSAVSAPIEAPEAMQDEQRSEDVLVELAKVVLRKHQLRKNEQASSFSRSRPAIIAAAHHAAGEMQEMTASIASAAYQLSIASSRRIRDFDGQTRTVQSKAQRAVEALRKKPLQG